jgi:hypothetical protein
MTRFVRRPTAPEWWWGTATLCYVGVAVTVVVDYGRRLAAGDPAFARGALHASILDGTAESPYRYRVLVPRLLDPFIARGPGGGPSPGSFDATFRLYFVVAVALILVGLAVVCRQFVAGGLAFAGPLLLAATVPIALRDHHYQPWSLLEPVFICVAIVLALRGTGPAGAVLLTVVATLNRETAFVIPLVFLAVAAYDSWADRRFEPRRFATAAGCAAAWLLTFLALRWLLGRAPSVDVDAMVAFNRRSEALRVAARNTALFLGPTILLVAAALAGRRAPGRLCAIALVVIPPYALSVYLYGVWAEVRLWLPLFPILLPLGLTALDGEGAPARPRREVPESSGYSGQSICDSGTPTARASASTSSRARPSPRP